MYFCYNSCTFDLIATLFFVANQENEDNEKWQKGRRQWKESNEEDKTLCVNLPYLYQLVTIDKHSCTFWSNSCTCWSYSSTFLYMNK